MAKGYLKLRVGRRKEGKIKAQEKIGGGGERKVSNSVHRHDGLESSGGN